MMDSTASSGPDGPCSGAWRRAAKLAAAVVLVAPAAGCMSLVGSMAADTLSSAILNEDDPALVESGVPAYLLLVDGLVAESPDNADLLAAASQLYALYGSRFEPDPERTVVLTRKARRYGRRAMCLVHSAACSWDGLSYDEFVTELGAVGRRNIDHLFAYSVSWLGYLDATSEDWSAVAELPWVDAALQRCLELDESYDEGAVHAYLGIINSLRPPALGGKPDVAKAHFERAIELNGGHDLSVKVEYAKRYARLVFDQELHDRLLNEVLEAPAEAPGYTLFNVLAKREAEELLASSKEYF